MDRNEAAGVFAGFLLRVGVQGGMEAFFDSLDEPVGQHRDTWAKLKQWYETQSDETIRTFRFAVREATILAVFGLAVHLDGASEYVYVNDHPAEFAVALRIYQDLQKAKEREAGETVEICPTRRGAHVHDLFLNLVEQAGPDQ